MSFSYKKNPNDYLYNFMYNKIKDLKDKKITSEFFNENKYNFKDSNGNLFDKSSINEYINAYQSLVETVNFPDLGISTRKITSKRYKGAIHILNGEFEQAKIILKDTINGYIKFMIMMCDLFNRMDIKRQLESY